MTLLRMGWGSRRVVQRLGLLVVLTLPTTRAKAVTLYDGSLGTSPSAQGWVYADEPLLTSSAFQTVGSSDITLDTTAVTNDKAGYFARTPLGAPLTIIHPGMITLDRTTGYTVNFTAQVLSETHISTDRAGLSIIALSSDLQGIEIGLWEDTAFAQDDSPTLFVKDESAAIDTTASLIDYALTIVGSSYSLAANGSPLLSGSLRDYSAHSNTVYSTPSFLFLGDNTTSAQAAFKLSHVSIDVLPEPSSMALLLAGMAIALRRTRTARRA